MNREGFRLRAEGAAARRALSTAETERLKQRRSDQGALLPHSPKVEQLCRCCAGALHRIGEDVAEGLEVIPAQFPGLRCAGRSTPAQATAPARLIEDVH